MFGLVSLVQIMGETDDFSSSGDDLAEPQTLPPAYTSNGSPVPHGRREGELSYSPEDGSIYSGSPSQGPGEGSGIQGGGLFGQGGLAEVFGAAMRSGAKDFSGRPKTPQPVLIAVMGKTGTGKTSFVNAVTGRGLTVGHGLEACEYSLSTAFPFMCLEDLPSNEAVGTQDIQTASTTINGREVQLIETPGFDDTDRSDVDILANIAKWVQRASYLRKHLSGIIYLHRIVDIRMEGSSVKNLRMLRELCGEKNFSNVILCTTMWDKVDEEEGRRREEELKSKETFWGNLVSRGAQVMRHRGPDFTASARKIAESFIQKDTIVLQLQEELGLNGSLSDTSAGRVLTSEIEDMKRKHQEEMEALGEEMKASSDKVEIELLKEYHEKEIEGLRKATEDLEKLRAEVSSDKREVELLKEYYEKEIEGLKRVNDDLEKSRAEDARRFHERLEDLEKLRAEDAKRFNDRLGGIGLQLCNLEGVFREGDEGLRRATDDLERLRAENARRFREELQNMQHQLGDHPKCIVC